MRKDEEKREKDSGYFKILVGRGIKADSMGIEEVSELFAEVESLRQGAK